jgi:uncharacterized protein (TIGR02996 family)
VIRSRIDDPEPWLVYADWLQTQSDPRGELVALQLRGEAPTTPAEHRARVIAENKILRTHAETLLGPITKDLFRFEWHRGFLSSLGNSLIPDAATEKASAYVEALDKALRHPACLFLREFFFQTSPALGPLGAYRILAVLAAHLPPTLDQITVEEPVSDGMAASILAAVPHVKHLRMLSVEPKIKKTVFPEIVSLRLGGVYPSRAGDLAAIEFPNVESLEIDVLAARQPNKLKKYFAAVNYPRLRHLVAGIGHPRPPFWEIFAGARMVNQITHLTLEPVDITVESFAGPFMEVAPHLNHLQQLTLVVPADTQRLFDPIRAQFGERLGFRLTERTRPSIPRKRLWGRAED